MNSHIIPVEDMRAPYILTGYEAIIPVKASNKFIEKAEGSGKVLAVSEKEVVVEYEKSGLKKYKPREWTTKELSGACYTHKLVPNVKAGQKVKKDDTILYDEMFFEPAMFDPSRVIYRQGNMVNVALSEEALTDEDSGMISSRLSNVFGTTVTKVKSMVVNCKDNVMNIVKVGDKLEPTSSLYSIVDETVNTKDLDERALSILQSIKNVTPKAKVKGVVSKIDFRYNCNVEDLSSTLKSLITANDKRLKDETGYTGQVDSSYSIQGKPLMEGDVEIKIYIQVKDSMGMGDKGILSNQLKFTVGQVLDYKIEGSIDKREVDLLFSYRAISARIVTSCLTIGTTSSLLNKIEEDICDMYFN